MDPNDKMNKSFIKKTVICKNCKRITYITSTLKLTRCKHSSCNFRFENPYTTIKNNM